MGTAVPPIFSWSSWRPEFAATIGTLFTDQWVLCLGPVQGKCITGQSNPTGYIIDTELTGPSSFVGPPVDPLPGCQTVADLVKVGLAFC